MEGIAKQPQEFHKQFAHNPTLVIGDLLLEHSSMHDTPERGSDTGDVASGIVFDGRTWLSRDVLCDGGGIEAILWHETLH